MSDDELYNRVGGERIAHRQIDELIGLARGIVADRQVNQLEAEFLLKWLAANADIVSEPIICEFYDRVAEILDDGILDIEEAQELQETLIAWTSNDFELGEALRATSLPLCSPAPRVHFVDQKFCFTGTFKSGKRSRCVSLVENLGGQAGSLTQKTNFLVIGSYATESLKHSAYGTKIVRACEFRDRGIPISIISEDHWLESLNGTE